jgi:hypothetical protein
LIARLTLLAAGLVPPAAGAATLCVSRDGGACQTTIQAAVDAARAGDTIRIAPGIYFENVTVPAGKDGLRVVGASAAASVIDPDPNRGTGIRVESNRVELLTLAIRDGQQFGVAIAGGVEGTLIRGMRFVGGGGPAAILAEAGSTRLRILSNEVRGAGAIGIQLAGANDASELRSNVVSQVVSGIVAAGAGLEIASNRVSATRSFGIRVDGPNAMVRNNVVESALLLPEAGLAVEGTNPLVRGNRLRSAGQLIVTCVSCSGGLVANNFSIGSFGPDFFTGGIGLKVGADGPGLVVRANRVSRALNAAFAIEGTGVRATQNVAIDTGHPDAGECFVVRGDGGHVLAHNVAARCGASGFRVDTHDVRLQGNLATEAGLNGFTVSGAAAADNVLVGNRAIAANAAGFAVIGDAAATVLKGNRGSGNRYDFCDDGTGTDVSGGNQFATTSSVCDVTR